MHYCTNKGFPLRDSNASSLFRPSDAALSIIAVNHGEVGADTDSYGGPFREYHDGLRCRTRGRLQTRQMRGLDQ